MLTWAKGYLSGAWTAPARVFEVHRHGRRSHIMGRRCAEHHTPERRDRPDFRDHAGRGQNGARGSGPPPLPRGERARAGAGGRPRLAAGRERVAGRVAAAGERRLHPAGQLGGGPGRSGAAAGHRAGAGARLVRGARPARVHPGRYGRPGHPGAAGGRPGQPRLDARGDGGAADRGAGAHRRPGRGCVPGGAHPGGGRAVAAPLPAVGRPRPRGAQGAARRAVRVVRGRAGRGGRGDRDRAVRGGRAVGRVRGRRGGPGAPAARAGLRRDGGAGPQGPGRGRIGRVPPGGDGQPGRPRAVRRAGLRHAPPLPPLARHPGGPS